MAIEFRSAGRLIIAVAISVSALGCSENKAYNIDDLVSLCKNNKKSSFCTKLSNTDLRSLEEDSLELLSIDNYQNDDSTIVTKSISEEELIGKINESANQEKNQELRLELVPHLENALKNDTQLSICFKTAISLSSLSVQTVIEILTDPVLIKAGKTIDANGQALGGLVNLGNTQAKQDKFDSTQLLLREKYKRFNEAFYGGKPSLIHNMLSCTEVWSAQ